MPSSPSIRLLGLSMVKNEQDVIEPFLRHHAALLDTIVLLDNASIDRTRDIAQACARELGNIVIGDSPEFSFLQSERMTRLLETAQSAFQADYVLFLDADEFVSAPDRDTLIDGLRSIPAEGAGLLPWRTFVIRPGEEEVTASDPPSSFTHRRCMEAPAFSKLVLRLDRAPATGLTIAQGYHTATRDGAYIEMVPLDKLHLLHFPVRSERQLITKTVVGWTACVARDPSARGKDTCFQWRDAFDCLTEGGRAAIARELSSISFQYAQARSPPKWDTEAVADRPPKVAGRRFSDGSFSDPLGLIAQSWERSLSRDATGSVPDGAAPVRFLTELHEPSRVLLVGAGANALTPLFEELGITCVSVGIWGSAEASDPFDLAIQCDGDDPEITTPDHVRVLLCLEGEARASALRFWTKRGYAVAPHDTGGVKALGGEFAQYAGALVLTRSMAMERPAMLTKST